MILMTTPKREGKYLAKQGDGLVGTSFCRPGKAHESHIHPEHDEVILYLNGIGIQTVEDEVYEITSLR